jgi:hypothetical protein
MAHRKEDQINKILLKVGKDSAGRPVACAAGILLPPSVGTTSRESQLIDSIRMETD